MNKFAKYDETEPALRLLNDDSSTFLKISPYLIDGYVVDQWHIHGADDRIVYGDLKAEASFMIDLRKSCVICRARVLQIPYNLFPMFITLIELVVNQRFKNQALYLKQPDALDKLQLLIRSCFDAPVKQ